jgi:adenylate kinase
MLRAAVAAETALGLEAKRYMDAGDLVPDSVVIGMIRERLEGGDGDGFLLDGFPRSAVQAEALDALLEEMGRPLDHVVLLTVEREELITRLLGRGRADDTRETIERRLEVYEAQTAPLIAYYRERGLLREIDGQQSMDAVHDEIAAALGS